MELLANIEGKQPPADNKSTELIKRLKHIIYAYDKTAKLILFGSRARGDWHEESDWDFLILTRIQVSETFKSKLRRTISDEIELPLDEGIFVIVKNKNDWEENYAVTNIYESISEEGIVV